MAYDKIERLEIRIITLEKDLVKTIHVVEKLECDLANAANVISDYICATREYLSTVESRLSGGSDED